MKISKTVCCALLFVFTGTLFAAYPLATDDAGMVAKDSYEFEAGYDDAKDENDLINRTCGVSFKYGVTEKMDIGISFPYRVHPASEENMGPASLGFKFSFIKDIFAVSFANEMGEKDYFVNTVFTKELSFMKCSVNGGYVSTGDENVKGKGSYGFSLEFPVKRFDIVSDLQGQEGGAGNILAGLRFRLKSSLFIASGIARDFDRDTNRFTSGFHAEF